MQINTAFDNWKHVSSIENPADLILKVATITKPKS